KQLVSEIATLMAYEVTKDLATSPVEIDTPLEHMTGLQVSGKKLTLVPILRAGLGMVDGITQLIPSARVGHIGLYRDHETLQPVDYYFKIPSDRVERDFFVLDPMLATGGSAVAAVSALKNAGARRIRFLCLVAAPEGVRRMLESHADIPIFAAAPDRELNAVGYIVPGLGDADAGLFQGRRKESHQLNAHLPFDARRIDSVVLSHAHIDHSGRLPLLVKEGFHGPIYATPATRDLSAVMLADAAHIQEKDHEFHRHRGKVGVEGEPL